MGGALGKVTYGQPITGLSLKVLLTGSVLWSLRARAPEPETLALQTCLYFQLGNILDPQCLHPRNGDNSTCPIIVLRVS